MEDMDYSYYDYQYSDWDVDTVDLHFVSGDSHSSLTHLTIILTAYGLKEPLLSWMALYIFVKKSKMPRKISQANFLVQGFLPEKRHFH
jgi:hypothetical protein